MSLQITIPGNIKQQCLPFVLRPGSKLNGDATASMNLKGAIGAQWFSFKNKKGDFPAGLGKIQICPSSLTNPNFGNYFKKDISYKLLYGSRDYENTKKSISIQDIFEAIPAMQIREYLPDTRLDQIINTIGELFTSIWQLGKSAINGFNVGMDELVGSGKTNFESAKDILSEVARFIIGSTSPSLLFKEDGSFRMSNPDASKLNIYGSNATICGLKFKIIDFVHYMYYKLQTRVTTNVYEIPAMLNDKVIMSSNGQAGWKGGAGVGLGQLTNGFLGQIPMIGTFLKNLIGNIQINWMPAWDATSGVASHPKVTVKFDLFNDTDEAAMMNFIFVNTLVPNNMFIQYGMFQHSSPLYDVRIAGFDRLYACSGSMQVESKGVIRNPPKSFIKKLVTTYANNGSGASKEIYVQSDSLLSAILKNNLIKIPDIYSVSMDFESMLPNSFNGYLFNYTHNLRMEDSYSNNEPFEGALLPKDFTKGIINDFETYFNKWKKQNGIPVNNKSEKK